MAKGGCHRHDLRRHPRHWQEHRQCVAAGQRFEVNDLGVDVPPQDLVQATKDFDADLIGISSLMMPSLPYIRDAIALVKENSELVDRFQIMVGGGPATREWVEPVGADGYADNAVEAVGEATMLMQSRGLS